MVNFPSRLATLFAESAFKLSLVLLSLAPALCVVELEDLWWSLHDSKGKADVGNEQLGLEVVAYSRASASPESYTCITPVSIAKSIISVSCFTVVHPDFSFYFSAYSLYVRKRIMRFFGNSSERV